VQAVNVGLLDTGGFAACPTTDHNILPAPDAIQLSLDMTMDETNGKPTSFQFVHFRLQL
jgi:hypothetical protein